MEPKPTFTWKDYGRARFYLSPDDGRDTNFGIVIYKRYGNMNDPYWVAVDDYESDYGETIIRDVDLDRVKAAAERHWFKRYLHG